VDEATEAMGLNASLLSLREANLPLIQSEVGSTRSSARGVTTTFAPTSVPLKSLPGIRYISAKLLSTDPPPSSPATAKMSVPKAPKCKEWLRGSREARFSG
jgi:hypothetical protein